MLHLAHDRSVRQRQTALDHHFSEGSKTELVTRVTTHAKDNNFAVEVAPVERLVDVPKLTHWLVLIKSSNATDRPFELHHSPRAFKLAGTLHHGMLQFHSGIQHVGFRVQRRGDLASGGRHTLEPVRRTRVQLVLKLSGFNLLSDLVRVNGCVVVAIRHSAFLYNWPTSALKLTAPRP
ncbi:hypothetical protein BN2475_140051 [Paraburkholderia ribeironis]|uniref:Uncharacterized protein n=1 Tax=Paraburkholderia ribeironis TaxID=1247936 RepID=A0A1N7RST2_9BURK|nr:hypothetical protein BN2475_140051 [Paraburkholderia ribeironis]